MIKKNIVLVGFMGSGKSLTSNKLAETLKREVISTDKLIEEKEGRPITDIFLDSGEAYFRKVEKQVVKGIAGREGVIIDCGGGVVLDPDNLRNLKKNGLVVYLCASAESLYKNIKDRGRRPLLNVEDPQAKIAELLAARKSYYEQADVTIDADHKTVDEITGAVLKVIPHD